MSQPRKSMYSKWESELAWPVVMASTMLLMLGLAAYFSRQPWLFPSLGPTAYLIARYPDLPVSRAYNSIAGHLVGMAGGFAGVAIFNAWQMPVVPLHEVTIERVLAVTVAIGFTVLVNGLLRSGHPPAAATTILVASGTFSTVRGAVAIAAGLVTVVIIGKALQYLRTKLTKIK